VKYTRYRKTNSACSYAYVGAKRVDLREAESKIVSLEARKSLGEG
jgi:hypothetical protein